MEQRLAVQTHIYGVTADWRIDPFVAISRVYRRQARCSATPGRAWVALLCARMTQDASTRLLVAMV